jgi:hypothetical protein
MNGNQPKLVSTQYPRVLMIRAFFRHSRAVRENRGVASLKDLLF